MLSGRTRLSRVEESASSLQDFQGGSGVVDWRGRDGNDPSVDIAKDADQRF